MRPKTTWRNDSLSATPSGLLQRPHQSLASQTAADADSKKLLPQVCFVSLMVMFTSIQLLGDATAGQMVGSSEDRNQQKYLGKVLGQVFLDLISYSDQDENKTN